VLEWPSVRSVSTPRAAAASVHYRAKSRHIPEKRVLARLV
jgi:hypothetical protein